MKILATLLFMTCAALGQSVTITGTGCASVSVTGKTTIGWQPVGSWTGTIQPKVALAGQAAVNSTATPSTSTTSAATVTTNGGYYTNISGYDTFLVCGNTVTGTATIYYVLSAKVH